MTAWKIRHLFKLVSAGPSFKGSGAVVLQAEFLDVLLPKVQAVVVLELGHCLSLARIVHECLQVIYCTYLYVPSNSKLPPPPPHFVHHAVITCTNIYIPSRGSWCCSFKMLDWWLHWQEQNKSVNNNGAVE